MEPPTPASKARLGDVGRIVAAHHVVDGALHGHLGQMRDHDHLMGARQVCEHLREGTGRGAADAGVDLVEHERINGVRLTEDHLGSEHDARELAAAGDAAQRTRRHAGTGTRRHAGTAAVEQLTSGWTLGSPALARERLAVPHELGAAQLATRPLLAHLAAHTRRRGGATRGPRPGGRGQLRRGSRARLAGSAPLRSRIFAREGRAGQLGGKLGELDVDAGQAGQLRAGLGSPALARERLAVPHELGAAHLETRHLLAHLAAKARRRSVPALGQRPSGFGKLGLGGIAGIAGAPHAGLGVIDKREQLSRLIAAGEDVLHMRAPLAQQALERRVALLRGGQLRRVKIDRITVSAQLSSRIFDAASSRRAKTSSICGPHWRSKPLNAE